ncbi:hypothetical protein ACQKNX_21365 [Lysinibacillus sp. NPDC093712]|uniref:hypothetical protein n=1 Tax=Lysinibacillus sp. NPDC093712 TaxID=3390579 RepID=UPI003D03FF89
MSAQLATDTVVVRATGSCVSTPVLVATVDTPAADLATDLDESVRDSVVLSTIDYIESTVVPIDDFAVITSSFVGTATNSVDLVAADFVVLSATGSLHLEKITV